MPMPNRTVSYATAFLGLVAALSPVVANLDWESTVGVIAGVGVVAAAALTWLRGWQSYEARNDVPEDLGITGEVSGDVPPQAL